MCTPFGPYNYSKRPDPCLVQTSSSQLNLGLVFVFSERELTFTFAICCRPSVRLVPKSVTLNDLERRNGRYFVLFQRIRVPFGRTA